MGGDQEQQDEMYSSRTGNRKLPGSSQTSLDALELLLGHSEIVSEFVDDRAPDLLAQLGLVVADSLDVLLVEHNVIRACWEAKDTLLGHRYAVKQAQAEQLWLARRRRLLIWRQVLDQNGNVVDAPAELLR